MGLLDSLKKLFGGGEVKSEEAQEAPVVDSAQEEAPVEETSAESNTEEKQEM